MEATFSFAGIFLFHLYGADSVEEEWICDSSVLFCISGYEKIYFQRFEVRENQKKKKILLIKKVER